MSPAFKPLRGTRGPHRQTLLGYFLRLRLNWPLPEEDLVVDAGDGIRLLCRATWQPGPREAHPALVFMHGLSGSDRSTYILSTGRLAYKRGWHVVRVNLRGAGDSLELCPRLYNAGLSGDLLAVLRAVAVRAPRMAVVGFSLGANVALLAAGRQAQELPKTLSSLVAVCPPLDLAGCTAAMESPRNRVYQWHFVRALRTLYDERQQRLPDLYVPGAADEVRTVREYDDAITAPHGGFADAAEYYARCSAGPYLTRVERPTLILTAEDDPMVPPETVARWPVPAAGHVTREVLPTGGHVGFVGETHAPGRFWAADRILAFVEAHERMAR